MIGCETEKVGKSNGKALGAGTKIILSLRGEKRGVI